MSKNVIITEGSTGRRMPDVQNILTPYLKVNGSWVPIEGQDISDVNLGS